MIENLGSADAWRYAAAGFAVVVLFLLVVGLRVHGDRLPIEWRVVLSAFVAEQAVVAYGLVTRAKDTPAGFPDAGVDLVLVGVALSLLLLLVSIVGVFVVERREDLRRRA